MCCNVKILIIKKTNKNLIFNFYYVYNRLFNAETFGKIINVLYFDSIAILSCNSEKISVKSPKFNLNNTKLVWLQQAAGGPHHSCMQLISCKWSSKEVCYY